MGDGRIRRRAWLWNLERQPEVRGQLPRHTDDAHRVGTVGCDRQVEDDVVEPEQLAYVGARLGRLLEGKDPGVVVTEPELARRAQHAVGHLAADRSAFA